MHIKYITRARMPTERAHGLQIAKMCEAYAKLGHKVTLVVPYRKNHILTGIVQYYDLSINIPISKISIPDTIIFSKWFPFLSFWIQAGLFLMKLITYPVTKGTMIITRSPEVAWLFSLRGYRVIYEAHELPKSKIKIFKYLLKSVHHIVCNSKGTANAMKKLGFEKAFAAPNAVDPKSMEPKISREEMRRTNDIDNNQFVPMYIGALESWKGYQTVLDASEAFDAHSVVVGGKKEQVRSLSSKYKKVNFLGTKPYRELGNYQNMADVLVIPNDPSFELDQMYTSPIKLFAHLVSGIPIIVTDLPSVQDIVSEKEVFFFDGSVDSLVKKYEEVMNNKDEAKKRAGRARKLGEQYTWANRARTILETIGQDT